MHRYHHLTCLGYPVPMRTNTLVRGKLSTCANGTPTQSQPDVPPHTHMQPTTAATDSALPSSVNAMASRVRTKFVKSTPAVLSDGAFQSPKMSTPGADATSAGCVDAARPSDPCHSRCTRTATKGCTTYAHHNDAKATTAHTTRTRARVSSDMWPDVPNAAPSRRWCTACFGCHY